MCCQPGGPHTEELGHLSSYLSYHPSGESELCGSLPTTGHQGNRKLILPAHPGPCLRPWAQKGASRAPSRGI